jgi:hypothetical protein
MMTRIQQHLESGLVPNVVYGRNEAPLVHLHESINQALADAAPDPSHRSSNSAAVDGR